MAVCGFLASREVREGIWGGIASKLHPTQTVVKVQQFATKLGLVLTARRVKQMMR